LKISKLRTGGGRVLKQGNATGSMVSLINGFFQWSLKFGKHHILTYSLVSYPMGYQSYTKGRGV